MAYSKIIHTKSEAPDVAPQPSSLTFGELAINYFDGKAYIKNTNNLVAKIGDTAYESRIGKLERDAAVAQNTIDKVALTFENAGITQHPLTFNNPHFVTSAQLLKYAGGAPGASGTYTIHDLTWVPDTEAILFTSPEFTGIPLAPTAAADSKHYTDRYYSICKNSGYSTSKHSGGRSYRWSTGHA